MQANLQTNLVMYVGHFDQMTLLYIKQYGAGNLRLSADGGRLQASIGLPTQDGVTQATADGFKQWYWQGDLYMISDAPGPVVWEVAGYVFGLERGKHRGFPGGERLESEYEGDLSTYQDR